MFLLLNLSQLSGSLLYLFTSRFQLINLSFKVTLVLLQLRNLIKYQS